MLFCGTTSPSCGTTRNLKSRGPDSVATARTRTVAGDPSAGSSAFSEPMIRPSSSTSTVTVRPEKPVCATTTSTSSEASLSTVRGTVTRSTWMSRWQRLAADAHGKYRQLLGLQAQQRLRQRRLARVGAVRHQHDAGDRQAGELFAHAVEGRAQLGLRSAEGELFGRLHPRSRRGETEHAHEEAVAERLEQRRGGGAELVLHVLAARLPGHVGNLHAGRVVEQHRDHVLLVHGGAHDQRGAEQAEEDDAEHRQAEDGQDDAIPGTALGDLDAAIGEDGERGRDGGQTGGEERRPGEVEAKLSLLEDDRAIGKESLKQGVKHWRRSPNP